MLSDWLMSVDLDRVTFRHPAPKQPLMDLLTEQETDVLGAGEVDPD